MSNSTRQLLKDGTFIEITFTPIRPDKWRPHGVRYRFAWVQNGKCRVLFDNHHGKKDHMHLDGVEMPFEFESISQLRREFVRMITKLGGSLE